MAALKNAHLKELEALTEARWVTEEELQLKYEKAAGELHSATEEHQRPFGAAERRVEAAHSEMR